jgi:hypothetical protein
LLQHVFEYGDGFENGRRLPAVNSRGWLLQECAQLVEMFARNRHPVAFECRSLAFASTVTPNFIPVLRLVEFRRKPGGKVVSRPSASIASRKVR